MFYAEVTYDDATSIDRIFYSFQAALEWLQNERCIESVLLERCVESTRPDSEDELSQHLDS